MMLMEDKRLVSIDWIRFIACFMVMLVHSIEPFYLGGDGTYIYRFRDAVWVTALGSALRSCVPLFVVISGYLLLPVKGPSVTFYKKRFLRVAVPLIVWLLLYAIVPQYGSSFSWEAVTRNLTRCIFNFPEAAGHLWFVFMILGVYLIMPVISPWLEKCSRQAEEVFLLVWAFTAILPFFRMSALNSFGLPEVYGEANWNLFGSFYYISGFIGYAVLGHYFRTWAGKDSVKNLLLKVLPLAVIGYAISAAWFWANMPKAFPVNHPIDLAVKMETGWGFCSMGTLMLTLAIFMVLRRIRSAGRFYRAVVLPISRLSYGMYLMHIFILNMVFPLVSRVMTHFFYGFFGYPALVMFGTALGTFVLSWGVAKVISLVPGGKYVIG